MSPGSNLIFIAVIIGVFYLLIIRPQQKRSRAQRDMLSALKAGDEIVTIGGMFGTVVEVGDRIVVRVFDGSEIELAKQAIAQVLPPNVDVEGPDESEAPKIEATEEPESASGEGERTETTE
jgi:preprotein translocase subunit YajC